MRTRFSPLIAALFLVIAASVQADADDETLKLYLSKSDLVVIGKFTREPTGIVWEPGITNYHCKFQVQDILKGDTGLNDRVIELTLKLLETDPKDKCPLIKKDSECILFLKKASPQNIPSWESADFSFGVQHPSTAMARSLKRLAADMLADKVIYKERVIDMDKVTVSFANALTDKLQEIVVAKRISQTELKKLVRPEDLNLLPFQALVKQGKGLHFYEVIDQITGSSKFLVYPVNEVYDGVRLPDTGTAAFNPPIQSQWLMILRPSALAAHDGKLRLVEFDDLINEVIAIKEDNRLNVNIPKFLADLKTLKSISETLKPDSILNLQTGLGEAILNQLLNKQR